MGKEMEIITDDLLAVGGDNDNNSNWTIERGHMGNNKRVHQLLKISFGDNGMELMD
jgi:hypothetical protein